MININNKLQERNSRSDSTIENLSQYINNLKLQRLRNPKHPKLYDLVPLPLDHIPNLNITSIIPQLENDTFLYTGIIKSKDRLYTKHTLEIEEAPNITQPSLKNVREYKRACQNDLFNDSNLINDFFHPKGEELCNLHNHNNYYLYYEFVDPSSFSTSTFINYKYLYLPVCSVVTAALNKHLPYINNWKFDTNNDNPIIYKSYPDKLNLLDSNTFEWSYFIQESISNEEDRIHPFLAQMYYTGRYTILDNGNKVYEYFDSKGYYGSLDNIYYSYLEPKVSINLSKSKDNLKLVGSSSSSIPTGEDIYTDIELQNKKDYLPKEGEYLSSPDYIKFSGYTTTPHYDSNTTYYIYIQEENSEVVLSTTEPISIAKSYIDSIKIQQGILYNDLILIEEESEQEIGIEQESLCVPIWLEDNTNNPDARSIFGDCLLVTDNTLADNKCTTINQSIFGDCIIISEAYMVTD